MDSPYKAALFAGERELRELIDKRLKTDERIKNLVLNIRSLCSLLDDDDLRIQHMSMLEATMEKLKKPGLSKVIWEALYANPNGLTTIEIRNVLVNSGNIDQKEYVNPTATIHTTLRRLIESG